MQGHGLKAAPTWGGFRFSWRGDGRVRCWAYIDGFNFYNGAAKRTGYKWVNLLTLSQQLRPNDTIERVKYFTAAVEARPNDPDQTRRQRTYWRALKTIDCLDRIEGQFRSHDRNMPLKASVDTLKELKRRGADLRGIRPITVKVVRAEEKGTDVNLAAHLVHDANQADPANTFEAALVLSTDSDLAEAIRLVTKEIGKNVYVCRPNPKNATSKLGSVATSVFDLPTRILRASLFPPTLADARGPFKSPPGWDGPSTRP